MSLTSRISAAIGYIPLLGWIYVLVAQREEKLVIFHTRQSIALVLGPLLAFGSWALITWLLAWIPYGDIFGIALFGLVIFVVILAVVDWIIGIIHALRGNMVKALLFSGIADRLPF